MAYWALPLVIFVLIWSANERANGSATQVIGGVLAILVFTCIVAAFVVSGWKMGLGALVGSFMLANVFRRQP